MKIKSFDDIDLALLKLGEIETKISTKEAAMNSEIQAIRSSYDTDTAELREQRTEINDAIELFCYDNKDEFAKQRSRTSMHGTVGFSNNPPKVLQLSKKWKIAETIKFIKKLFKGIYIREIQKEELDKEAILRDYGRKDDNGKVLLDDKKLASVGLRIEQDERFYIEINWETLKSEAA
jgi:phage host-nuclease inhibitor protein Gam